MAGDIGCGCTEISGAVLTSNMCPVSSRPVPYTEAAASRSARIRGWGTPTATGGPLLAPLKHAKTPLFLVIRSMKG